MSWIITHRETGKAVFEIFNPKVAAAVNRDRYNVQTALEYLQAMNAIVRA